MTLTKGHRLRKRSDFQTVYRAGKTVYGRFFRAVVRSADSYKIAVVMAKKIGNSPQRHRLKRLFKEAFRGVVGRLSHPVEIVAFPKAMDGRLRMDAVYADLFGALRKT